jgi:hypothetical protein
MSDVILVHEKNNWTLTLYRDGTIFLYTHYARRFNSGHLLGPDDVVQPGRLPVYVEKMVREAREKLA